MLNRTIDFLKTHIWRIDFENLPPHQRVLLRPLRVLLLAVRGFDEDRIQLRASALTYYTLLSVVPVLAVAFGIAKGFGLAESLEQLITRNVQAPEDSLQHIVRYANEALANARGGLVAGVGVVFLFWSVIRLLSTVELSLNDIWGVRQGRSLGRRVVDYLALIMITPVVLTVTAAMFTRATGLENTGSPTANFLGDLTRTVGGVLPFIVNAVFFGTLYRFMPHAHVSVRAAVLGGAVTGTVNMVTQWAFFALQTYMAGYSAIYASLSALPLLLIWLQLSWLVILFGAEIAYAVDNEETYAQEREWGAVSQRMQRVLGVRFVEIIARRFEKGDAPVSADQLAHQLELPARLARRILYDLVSADVLVSVLCDGDEDDHFLPARGIEGLTVKRVLDALEHTGEEPLELSSKDDFQLASEILRRFDARIEAAPENVPLHRLDDVRPLTDAPPARPGDADRSRDASSSDDSRASSSASETRSG